MIVHRSGCCLFVFVFFVAALVLVIVCHVFCYYVAFLSSWEGGMSGRLCNMSRDLVSWTAACPGAGDLRAPPADWWPRGGAGSGVVRRVGGIQVSVTSGASGRYGT